MGAGVSLFLFPNQLSSGGFTGVAILINHILKFPVGTTILILNIPLFILAFLKLGKVYVAKSILGTVLLSFSIDAFAKIKQLTGDRFLACIYGGIILGIGLAFVFKGNSSTGGTDILAKLLNKIKPGLSTSQIVMGIDVVIVATNVIAFKEIEIGLYSAIAIFMVGKMLDIFFEGFNFAKMVFIVSDKSKEISDEILKTMKRGSTALYGKGMYTNEEKLVLFSITGRNELIQIKQIAKNIDEKSFVIVNNVREVLGKGFD